MKFIRVLKSFKTFEEYEEHVKELNKTCRDVATQVRKVLINNNLNYRVEKKGTGRIIINNYGKQKQEIIKVLENNFNVEYKQSPYLSKPDMFINKIEITII